MSRLFTNNTTDVVTVSPAASINNLDKHTHSLWVKLTVAPGAGEYCLSFSRGDIFREVDYFANSGSDGYTLVDVMDNFDGTGAHSSVDTPIAGDTWIHFAQSFDDTADRKIHTFLNGVEVSSYVDQIAATGALDDNSSFPLLVGNLPTDHSVSFGGKMFDFRLYDSILSAGELAAIVALGPTYDPQPTHLKVQLTFETDQGATEPDASGNSNTGAITGATFDSDNPSFMPPPTVDSINPAAGHQGVNAKHVTVIGSDFDATAATVSFSGTGVDVVGYVSRSATHIEVLVSIDPAAAATARDVTVTNGDTQTDTLSAAFTVVSFTPGGNSGPTSRTVRFPRVPRRGIA